MMGIITIRPGEGSFVRQVSYEGMLEPLSFLLQVEIDDIMQLLEVRKILEVETAALAAIRAKPQNIEEMKNALLSMIEEVNAGQIGDRSDAAFHFAVARAANNPVLIKVMYTISDLMTNTFKASRQKLFLVEEMPQLVYQSHCEIFEAIRDKNPASSRRRMRDHLTMVEEAMKRLKHGSIKSVKDLGELNNEHKIKNDFGFPS